MTPKPHHRGGSRDTQQAFALKVISFSTDGWCSKVVELATLVELSSFLRQQLLSAIFSVRQTGAHVRASRDSPSSLTTSPVSRIASKVFSN